MIHAIKIGLIGGGVEILLALIGMIEAFSQRDIISDVMSMGHTLLLMVALFTGYLAAKVAHGLRPHRFFVNGLVSGLMVGGLVALLVVVGNLIRLRSVFLNASPALYKLLTFDCGIETGVFLLLIAGIVSGGLTALF